jgi:predicted RNase H-like HicB family nuclease
VYLYDTHAGSPSGVTRLHAHGEAQRFGTPRRKPMQYTLILTETSEGGIQVTIPGLPACRIEAATRDEAIQLARAAIAQLVSRSEIVQIDIPQQPRATAQSRGVPWEWFGEAKADPTWDALFDDLEQRREATRDVD